MNLSQVALHRCMIYMHMDSPGSPLTVWELWTSRVSACFVCMQVNRVCGEQFSTMQSPKHQLLSTDSLVHRTTSPGINMHYWVQQCMHCFF